MTAEVRPIRTRKGIPAKVHVRGSTGSPVVYFHGAGGLAAHEPMLDALAERHVVYAAEWPGFGEEPTETEIEDMLDFALHGWDIVDALGLDSPPHVVGHSMGGMIAAEMAALNPAGLDRLVLVAAAGIWIDSSPVPDIFAMLPMELAKVLFSDPAAGEAILTAGLDFGNDAALGEFMIANSRRLGTAGKVLFPIPNRRLSKRLYRIVNPTLLVWGTQDRLFPPVYAERFIELLVSTSARIDWIEGGGHMTPYEQSAAAAAAIVAHLEAYGR